MWLLIFACPGFNHSKTITMKYIAHEFKKPIFMCKYKNVKYILGSITIKSSIKQTEINCKKKEMKRAIKVCLETRIMVTYLLKLKIRFIRF